MLFNAQALISRSWWSLNNGHLIHLSKITVYHHPKLITGHITCTWQLPLYQMSQLSCHSIACHSIASHTSIRALSDGLSALIEVCFLSHTFVKQENSYLQACQQPFPQPSLVVNTVHISSLATSSIHLSIVPSSVHLSIQSARRAIYFVCLWRKWMLAITLLSADPEIAIRWP